MTAEPSRQDFHEGLKDWLKDRRSKNNEGSWGDPWSVLNELVFEVVDSWRTKGRFPWEAVEGSAANAAKKTDLATAAGPGFATYMHKLFAHWAKKTPSGEEAIALPLTLQLFAFAEWLHETRHMDVEETFEALLLVEFGRGGE